jgi:hypothetical protein
VDPIHVQIATAVACIARVRRGLRACATQWHALRTTRAHTAPLSACAFNGVRRDSDTRTTEQARLGQVDCPAEVLGKI